MKQWYHFNEGLWQKEINVRDFIQHNYMPYAGNESFLEEATPRTKGLLAKLEKLKAEELKKRCLIH